MPHRLSFLTRMLGRTQVQDYKLAENYVLLRDMVFTTKPDAIGLVRPAEPEDVWGVVMETGYPEAVATLVALADGSVSLYFSNGGGIIGMGSREGPHRSAQALLEMAPRFRDECQPTTRFPLPPKSQVSFYLFTYAATVFSEALEEHLANRAHPLAPLFRQAHELITAIRLVEEKAHAEQMPCPGSSPAHGT